MSKVLIHYPKEFSCYPKFVRKVRRILSTIRSVELVFSDDPREYISRFCDESENVVLGSQFDDVSLVLDRFAYAILFSAGEKADKTLRTSMEMAGITVRNIDVKLAKVVNIDKGDKYDVYIGRGSKYGNPYAMGFDGDRDEVIRKFAYDFERGFILGEKDERADLAKLAGKRLGCHCIPAPCHGDVIAEYINSIDENR